MANNILNNGLNVADTQRLTDASIKLSDNYQGQQYFFNNQVQPVMIAGVEENQTDSSVNLISALRDNEGLNRLTVDTVGMPTLSGGQIEWSYNYSTGGGSVVFAPTFPINTTNPNQKLYINQIIWANLTSSPQLYTFIVDHNGTSGTEYYGQAQVPANNSIIITGMTIPVSPTDTLTVTSSDTSGASLWNTWGFFQ